MQPIFEVTAEQLSLWITSLLWPMVRVLALVSTAPILGEAAVPRRAKLLLAMLVAFVISPSLPPLPTVPLVSGASLWILAQQILIGVTLGFAMRLVFAVVQAAGEYLGLAMGLSFASFFDPTAGGNTVVLGRILHVLLALVFLAVDGHLLMLQVIAQSFQTLPISDAPLAANGFKHLALAGAQLFASGLMLALPLVTALLAINMCMGILNRASPQISIFSIGFPLTLLAGLGLLITLMPTLSPWMQAHIAQGLQLMQQVVQGLAPR
jgi:flagellar biosynthesis protein FliR